MKEGYKESYSGEFSETNWAEEFLGRALKQLPEGANLGQFRGMLDAEKIQANEADDFLQAYINGPEATNNFLADRNNKQKDQEHIIPLPERENSEYHDHHGIAA